MTLGLHDDNIPVGGPFRMTNAMRPFFEMDEGVSLAKLFTLDLPIHPPRFQWKVKT